MRSFSRWLLVAVLALASCAAPHPEPAHLSTEARQFIRIVGDLADPAMEGRSPRTRGLERARDYVVARFTAAGLQPAIARPVAFTQSFALPVDVRVKHEMLALGGDAKHGPQSLEAGTDYNVAGLSASGHFSGGAVFVGYGIVDDNHRYDSYRSVDPGVLRGKVAIAYRFEPQNENGASQWALRDSQTMGAWTAAANLLGKARWASEHGAVALLVINPPKHAGLGLLSIHKSTVSPPAPIPVFHVALETFRHMLDLAGRDGDQIPEYLQAQADLGRSCVLPLDKLSVNGEVDLDQSTVTVQNVLGVLPGRGVLADQYVVVGAHYDHLGFGDPGTLAPEHALHPGADDNASGVAGLVLLAQRAVARHAAPMTDQRSILFVAFTGEERGLLGSEHLLGHLDDLGLRRQQIVAMLNMDMIGRLRDDQLIIFDADAGSRFRAIVRDAAAPVGLNITFKNPLPGVSDHASFQAAQIPALHFYTGPHEDYHRPSDTVDKINADGAVRVIEAIDRVLAAMCSEASLHR